MNTRVKLNGHTILHVNEGCLDRGELVGRLREVENQNVFVSVDEIEVPVAEVGSRVKLIRIDPVTGEETDIEYGHIYLVGPFECVIIIDGSFVRWSHTVEVSLLNGIRDSELQEMAGSCRVEVVA